MIEVDVFWSFSFGAVFAACSAGTLKNTPESQFWLTPSFVYTLLFLSLIFAPSGLYLLWDNPGWESMYLLGDKNEIHALLPTVFAFTNVLLGIIGYYVTYRSIRRHRKETTLNMGMNKYWDWRAGKVFELTDFAFSRMLVTLLAMGVFLLPAAYIPAYFWLKSETLLAVGDKSRMFFSCLTYIIQGMITVSALFATYNFSNFKNDSSQSLSENAWRLFDNGNILDRNSQWSPLLGFWVAEVLVMLLVSLPIYVIPSVKAPAHKTVKTQ
ncbi:hypothetical protein EC957_003971 [Mortierella hygrophila]|uniref:Uncharacterized protein n=1 Tax=Mortierella hygrophila TaxID=979708 RepID=A0A9P6K0L5_9FUNG|nr:hypothetical protein EC957_003971 [Mortierella hygrophila]